VLTGLHPNNDPERVVVAGDWHGNSDFAARVITTAAAAGVQIIVHVGDFGFRNPETARYLDAVDESCIEHGVQIFWIEGNRDNLPALNQLPVDPETGLRSVRPHLTHLPRGTRWSWRGRTWLALGGSYSLNRRESTWGVHWWNGERLTDTDIARAISGGPADVMITHDSPDRTDLMSHIAHGDYTDEHRFAAQQHREAMGRVVDAVAPGMLFHGHYHQRHTTERPLPGGGHTRVVGLSSDRDSLEGNWIIVDMSGSNGIVVAPDSMAAQPISPR
jgi:Icc-related predicted phosphoesterase